MTKAKTKWMPGKERPAASRLAIQRPPTTKPHQKNLCRNKKPSAGQPHKANRRGSRLPIPSEPAPCHRPWITLQGATPAERLQHNTQPDALDIRTNSDHTNHALQKDTAAR